MKLDKAVLFIGGVLFGTAGVSILSGEDAKKAYTQCTAAVLRGKDSVMKTAAAVKENCGDIYADAKDINGNRYDEHKKAMIAEARAIVEQYENADSEESKEAAE